MKYLLSLFAFIFLLSCNSQNQNAKSKYSVIEYEAGACFGFCPVYKMTINADRTAVLEAEHFNFTKTPSKDDFSKEREGTFTATIKESDYKKLVSLLDGLNVQSLKENYGNHNITDLSSAYLRIKFADGTSKNVKDYGKHGSEKLTELYQFFEKLKHNQQWVKVK
ncbi:hypothetical protein M2347_002608 [Chryseobacterium sp. H1D6B]|uniref:DUF6438 domain-containing protein n=1 Tax=Chryseobacterium sp. H1D6B TaxID=2940588 RepID=UPI0015CE62FA|nr:DUF6438 domain-containing protein [Chryseobacterium sp. H1D6B]MDH6252881.1 hypothetical protein [Chryseobacterium sp. H1D6B]